MMKHMYGIVMGLFMLTLVSVAYVSADDSVSSSSSTGSVATGSSTGKLADLKREHKAEKMELFDSIRENWTATVSENASGTKAFAQASTQVRKAAFSGCKVLVDQVGSGSLTKESALAQCKEIKTQMNEAIAAMRNELQAARKTNRETTKTQNTQLKNELKETQKSETKTVKEEIKTEKKSFQETVKARIEEIQQQKKAKSAEDSSKNNNKDDNKKNEVKSHDDDSSGSGSIASGTVVLPIV